MKNPSDFTSDATLKELLEAHLALGEALKRHLERFSVNVENANAAAPNLQPEAPRAAVLTAEKEAIRKFLGLPEGMDPDFARGTKVHIPMARGNR